MTSPITRAERRAPIDPCPQCDGRGRWRPGTGPEPRPIVVELPTDGSGRAFSTEGDQSVWTPGGGSWVECGDCHGSGRTTWGRRVGRRSWKYGSSDSSRCPRCRTLWKFVAMTGVDCTPGSGTSLMCDLCFGEASLEECLDYHQVLQEKREADREKAGHVTNGWWLRPWPWLEIGVRRAKVLGEHRCTHAFMELTADGKISSSPVFPVELGVWRAYSIECIAAGVSPPWAVDQTGDADHAHVFRSEWDRATNEMGVI